MSRDFNGTTSVLNCGNQADVQNLAALSAVLWIDPDSAGETDNGRIFGKRGSSAGSSGWGLQFAGAGRNVSFIVDCDTVDLIQETADTIPTNTWSCLGVTWDGSTTAANVHIYINGVEATYQATTDGLVLRSDDSANPITIGNSTNATRTVDGQIAQVQLFNTVLTREEVQQAMVYPGSVQRGLLRYWSLGGDGSPEPNYTVAGSGATITTAGAPNDNNPPINGMFVVPRPIGASAC